MAAWNCYGSAHRKLPLLLDLFAPDLLVVPECGPGPFATATDELHRNMAHEWIGDVDNPSKGLGLFATRDRRLDRVRSSDDYVESMWVATRLAEPDPLTFVGMVGRPHPGGSQGWPSAYIAAFADALGHLEDLIEKDPTIVAGDFNFSAQSSPGRIQRIFDLARSMGLRSAYHDFYGVAPGEEADMTLAWMWKPEKGYHCDLVFVSDHFDIVQVHVGSFDNWTIPGNTIRSDHTPVIVDLIVR